MTWQEYCEAEYKKLTESENVDQNLINHPAFYQCFSEMVMNATKQEPEKFPIEIQYNNSNKTIEITSKRDFPDLPHGEFRGLNEFYNYSIGLENQSDKTFLCLRSESSTMARNHEYKKGNLLCYAKTLDVYENSTQVGRMRFSGSNFYPSTEKEAFIPSEIPKLEVGFAIQGMLPIKNDNTNLLDYQVESVGRYTSAPDDIVIRRRAWNTLEGEYKGYGESEAYSYTNRENTQSLNNLSDACIARKDMGSSEVHLFDDSFGTLEELLEYYSNKYSGVSKQHRR